MDPVRRVNLRRKVMITTFPLLFLPLFAAAGIGAGLGSLELLVWLAIVMFWLGLFIFWGDR